jgi:dUTPase
MKIFNEFGINPTTTHRAAGYDFYIPNITLTPEESDFIFEAFSKSYGKTIEELHHILNELCTSVNYFKGEGMSNGQEMNLLLLYLAFDCPALKIPNINKFDSFVNDYLIFDKDGKPGIQPQEGDYLFVNSGIHVALNPGTAGLFVNKSGRGTKGWDVRACLVDEDYAGFVHLSIAYTKKNFGDAKIYVGDKLVQMIIINVEQDDVINLNKEDYEMTMAESERGSDGFGSSDEKH